MIAEQPSIELLPAVQNRFADQPIVIASGSGELSEPVASPMMFEHIERIARMIAFNRFCPAHLSKGQTPEQTIATCFRIAAQAVRWHVDPFALADETYEVRGKLGYQGKLIASIINARAGLDGRLSYTTSGTGDDLTVTVSGKFKNETEPRTVQAVLKHSRTDNEMWKKDPEQKLCYVGAIKWARRHCPEFITGVLTTEDLDVIAEGNAPAPESEEVKAARAAEARAAQRAALAGKVGAVEGAAAAGVTAAPATSPAVTATPQAKSEATVVVPAKPSAATAKAPATTKPEPRTITTATLADEALKTKVRAAWTATGKPNTEFASHVAAYGKAKLSDLTQIEADDLLGRLLALDPNATKDSARVNGMEANAGTSTDETPVAAKTQAGEQPVDGGNAEGAKDGLVLPDDPFAALSASYGTSTPEQRAEFETLAKELKWSPAPFFKRNRTPVIGQMSAQVAARGLALLALYKSAGEAKVMEAAEATFGQQSVYEYTGAQLKYLAGVLACPF